MPRGYTTELGTALAQRYLVEASIGKGGMATVYRALDLKHDRRVALKVLNPELGAVLGADRFLTEIKVTATLQHPNLLTLIDSGEANGLLYYVMPLLDGETLRARIEREGQMPVDDAVRIAIGVAQALEYAHARGVIHRDLKPENIMLQQGQPIVVDFGIALAMTQASDARMTGTGISIGTPQYMSPEQAGGEKHLDARTDVYALGSVLYEMLSGKVPHAAPTTQAVMQRVMTVEAPPIATARPMVPPHVAQALEHALRRLPSERMGSAREFIDALSAPRPRSTSAVSLGAGAPSSTGHSTTVLVATAVATGVVGFLIGAALRR